MNTAYLPVTLVDGVNSRGLSCNTDLLRTVQVTTGHLTDLFRHRRREECNLTRLRHLLQNPIYVVDETHLQHFICFIQNHRLHGAGVQRVTTQVIHHTTWRTHDNLRATLQLFQLQRHAVTAINRQYVEAFHITGITLERFSNLNRQLTRRCQNQHLRAVLLHINTGQQR